MTGTLLKKLRTLHPDWTFIDEPVETWTQLKNEKGNLIEVSSVYRRGFVFEYNSTLIEFLR